MKKIKLFGTLLLLLPGIASCDGLSDTPGKEEEKEETPSGLLDDLNTNISDDNTDNKTSDEKKEEPNDATKYLITFYNGSVKLAEVEKPAGTYSLASIYTGNTPTKEGNTQYSYSFKGWSTSSTSSTTVTAYKISKDTPFYAVFNENLKEYNITWKNFDGSTLATTTHKYGTVPSYSGATPTGPKDTLATYTFKGWAKEVNGSVLSPLPVVTKADTYYAVFESTINVTKETLKADTRKLTAKGDGYTYLDYNLEEKYKSWNDLMSGGYITKAGNYITIGNLDSLGKGILQFPEDSSLIYASNTKNIFENNELIDGVNIPAVIWKASMTGFAYECTSIRTVNFLAPKSGSTNVITEIGSDAFKNCTNLESVTFSNPNITKIGTYVFNGCTKLKTVTLPSKLETIENLAFENTSSLGDIVLPSTMKSISTDGFLNSGITKLTVNSTVSFAASSFESCARLASVAFGTSGKVKINGSKVFEDCTSLASFNFSKLEFSDVDSNYYTFQNTGFTSVDLSSATFTVIPNGTFSGLPNLTSVKLKSTITTIGNNAFNGCKNLTTVNNLNPSNVSMGRSCFSGCSKLNTFGFTSGTKFSSVTLAMSSFNGTGFTSIDITASSLSGASNCFSDMPNLTTATIKITNDTTLPLSLFGGCEKLQTLNLTVKYDTSLVNTSTKVDSNKFYLGTSPSYATAFMDCNALENINFSGTVDQFMSYYYWVRMFSVDAALNITKNTKLKVKCAKGCVKDSVTSAVTINNSNFMSYMNKFGAA